MASLLSLSHFNLPSLSLTTRTSLSFQTPISFPTAMPRPRLRLASGSLLCAAYGFSSASDDEEAREGEGLGFEDAVALFNCRDYYECHDVLEGMWYSAQDPTRTLLHGVLQCAVGFHHLFNHNHKGAMMELGEGLCKLRKLNFDSGPFFQFEREISAVLDFIYQTQLELAACADDFCLALDQSERSYQLLGGYAAGQKLYSLQADPNGTMHVIFCSEKYKTSEPPRVKLPVLLASDEHLKHVENDGWT